MANRLMVMFVLAGLLVGVAKCGDDSDASSFSGAVDFVTGSSDSACSTSISDAFAGDLTLWSEHGTSGMWTITSAEAYASDQSVLLYTDEQTCTVTQWAMAKFLITYGQIYSGFYLRSQNDETQYSYALRYEETETDFVWRYCGGSNNGNVAEACQDISTTVWDRTLNDGDYVGVEITGAGDLTVVKVYDLGVSAKSYANWASSADASVTFTDNPTYPADTGKYIGLYNGGSTDVAFDDFQAGSE